MKKNENRSIYGKIWTQVRDLLFWATLYLSKLSTTDRSRLSTSMDSNRCILISLIALVIVCQCQSYLHDAGEKDDKQIGTGEVANDGINARSAATVDTEPDKHERSTDCSESDLNVQNNQTRPLVEHGIGHVRRRTVDVCGVVDTDTRHCSVRVLLPL